MQKNHQPGGQDIGNYSVKGAKRKMKVKTAQELWQQKNNICIMGIPEGEEKGTEIKIKSNNG